MARPLRAPAAPPVTASIDCLEVVVGGQFQRCDWQVTNTGSETLTCKATIYYSEDGSVRAVDSDENNVIEPGQSFNGYVRIKTDPNSSSGNARIVARCQSEDGFVEDRDGFRIK